MSDMDKMLAFWLPFRTLFKKTRASKIQGFQYSKIIYDKENLEKELMPSEQEESDEYYDEEEEGDVYEEE